MPKIRRFLSRHPIAVVLFMCLLVLGTWLWIKNRPSSVPVTLLPQKIWVTPISFQQLPGWAQDNIGEIIPALENSCAKYKKLAPERPVGSADWRIKVADWLPLCQELGLIGSSFSDVARFLEKWLQPVALQPFQAIPGLFTGYYEPEIQGSTLPDANHQIPLYRVPDDLIIVDLGKFREEWKNQQIIGRITDGTLQPYYTREQIAQGAIKGKGQEIIWLQDRIDGFFLEIQGSGVIRLPDNQQIRVGYAGKNGHPYRAVGAKFIQDGILTREQVSLQSIREWLSRHPEQQQKVMNFNPSYVFFNLLPADIKGAIGAQGVVLTAGRSMAVDPAYIPLGTLLWLDSTWPFVPKGAGESGNPVLERKLQRLMIAQDTGGAIKGPIRGDVFWGTGEAAGNIAGYMKQNGTYYLIVPKTVSIPAELTVK